jgi:hypothetical protein
MSTLTITLPDPILKRLKRASELTYRPVDEILVTTINAALVVPPDMPEEIANELAAMNLLSDDALKAAAQSSFSSAQQYRLRQLNEMAQERALTQSETKEQESLLQAYPQAVLSRAQALAILNKRGHSIPFESPSYSPFDD